MQCKGKLVFDTKTEAETYLWRKRMNTLGYTANFKVKRSYECKSCKKYHLTSKDKF